MKSVGQVLADFMVHLYELENNTSLTKSLKEYLQTRIATIADILGDDLPTEYEEKLYKALEK